jgi:allophanate hydrolase
LRVGVPSQTIVHGDAGYGAAYEAAIAHLRDLGHEVVALDFAPLHAVAGQLYGGPWVAERHAVVEQLLERHPEAIDPIVRTVIASALTITATDAFRGIYALREAQRDTREVWDQVDVLMVPTAPGHPRFTEVDDEPVAVNTQLGTYTNFVNLLGWCALALPASLTTSGLPFGVTFVAARARDAALARFGATWQASLALTLGATGRAFPKDAASVEHTPTPAVEATLAVAVVGAHLSGLPLNPQLLAFGAHRLEATHTAPSYRLYALPATTPAKPGMLRVADGGAAIAVEVWAIPSANVGALLASIAAPLGLGSVELADGRRVHGFLCEAHAVAGATDITRHGGWRAYLASLTPSSANGASNA